MAEPDDLLSKADALMARHHPGRAPTAPYARFRCSRRGGTPEASDDVPLLTEYLVPAPPDEEQIKALAASIGASLLAALQPRSIP